MVGFIVYRKSQTNSVETQKQNINRIKADDNIDSSQLVPTVTKIKPINAEVNQPKTEVIEKSGTKALERESSF
jgi:hypothetical protein